MAHTARNTDVSFGSPQEPVTWRELELSLDPLRGSLKRIEEKVDFELTEMRGEVRAFRIIAEDRAFFGGRGRTIINGLMIAIPVSLVSAAVALAFSNL